MGPAHPNAGSHLVDAAEAAAPWFRLVVVTDEYFPIPGAAVLILDLELNLTMNATGGAAVDLRPGAYDVVASREGYRTNRTRIEVGGNQTEALAIELERLPRLHPHYMVTWPRAVGVCSAYRIDPVVHDRECRDDPDPNYTPWVEFDLPMDLAFVLLHIKWEPGSVAAATTLRFQAQVLDEEGPMAFADGTTALSVEGTTGLALDIPAELVTAAMKESRPTLEVRAFPSEAPQDAPFYSQRFEVFATIVSWLPPSP